MLVDPPELSFDEIDELEAVGEPSAVLITNRTHWRATAEHLGRWPLRVLAHEVEAPRLPRAEATLREGDPVCGGWRVVFVPGKTIGEIALHHPSDGGTLLVGDTLIGEPPGGVRLLPNAKLEDPAQLLDSLRRIAGLSFERLLVGDGNSILHGADRIVRAFVRDLAD